MSIIWKTRFITRFLYRIDFGLFRSIYEKSDQSALNICVDAAREKLS